MCAAHKLSRGPHSGIVFSRHTTSLTHPSTPPSKATMREIVHIQVGCKSKQPGSCLCWVHVLAGRVADSPRLRLILRAGRPVRQPDRCQVLVSRARHLGWPAAPPALPFRRCCPMCLSHAPAREEASLTKKRPPPRPRPNLTSCPSPTTTTGKWSLTSTELTPLARTMATATCPLKNSNFTYRRAQLLLPFEVILNQIFGISRACSGLGPLAKLGSPGGSAW